MQLTLNAYFPLLSLLEDPQNRRSYLMAVLPRVEVDSPEYELLVEELRKLERTFIN